jgi:hypothetical protein
MTESLLDRGRGLEVRFAFGRPRLGPCFDPENA